MDLASNRSVVEKVVFLLMLAASMAVAGWITSGGYRTEVEPFLTQQLNITLFSQQPFQCNISSTIGETAASFFQGTRGFFPYTSNTRFACSTSDILLNLAPLPASQKADSDYYPPDLLIGVGFNSVQLFVQYEADDDDEMDAELIEAAFTSLVLPGILDDGAVSIIQLASPIASTHQWIIGNNAIAASVIAFLCLGFAGLFTFVLWGVSWRQRNDSYAAVP